MKAFENVMGYDSLKRELMEIIDIMQNKEVYEALHAKCPSGLLLYGNPGVGKTLIANSFIEASGRPAVVCRKNASEQSFIDSINQAFEDALAKAPSIILLDDMDKFANDDKDHKDSEAYVTIQSCIDMVKGKDVFVVATANNISKLPSSLVRTGRFDRRVEVDTPSDEDSQKIIEHYLAGMGLDDDVDVKMVAAFFRGASCSTLETVVNQAAIIAGSKRADHITMEDLILSYVQIAHTVPKDDLLVPSGVDLNANDESADVFWHEAGHIVMSELFSPGCVTIAMAVRKKDSHHGFSLANFSKFNMNILAKRKADIMISLAGAAAMDITFGRVDLGAQRDVEGSVQTVDEIFDLGGFTGLSLVENPYDRKSESLRERREAAASMIAELYYQEAKELLCQHRAFLEAVAQALAEKVVITAIDIVGIRKTLGM